MSGGAFNYEDYKIEELADMLKDEIQSELHIKHDTEFGYCKKSDEFIEKLKILYGTLYACRTLMHRFDWVLSGDDDEQDFEPRLKKDLEELKNEKNIEVDIFMENNEFKIKIKELPVFEAKSKWEDD